MKSLSLSGGGTKVAAIAGAAIELLENQEYKPDIIVGTSAGGILALPLALGKFNEIKSLILSMDLDDIFDKKPVNKKGKIRILSILRLLFGANALGSQNNLKKSISKVISKEDFEKYKVSDEYPKCFLIAVDLKTGSRTYADIKNSTYEEYLNYVVATSSIPVFVKPVEMNGACYFDGGLRDHIGTAKILEEYSIEENVSIYSRPKDCHSVVLDWKPNNIFTILMRTIDIMLTEISKNDEYEEDKISSEKGIKNTKIFMPYQLSSGAYQLDSTELLRWYNIGKESTLRQYKK